MTLLKNSISLALSKNCLRLQEKKQLKTTESIKQSKAFQPYDTGDLPHEEVTEALPVSQKNIWCNAYQSEKATASRDHLTR